MAIPNTPANTLIGVAHTTSFHNAKQQMDRTLYSNLTSPSKENTLVTEHVETYGEARLQFTSTPPPMRDSVQEMLEEFRAELETFVQKERLDWKAERETALQKERLDWKAELETALQKERLDWKAELETTLQKERLDWEALQARIATIEQTVKLRQYGIAMRGFIDGIELKAGAPKWNRGTWRSQNTAALALLANMFEADLAYAFDTVIGGDGYTDVDSSSVAHAIAAMDPADGKAGFENLFIHYLGHAIEDEIEGRVAATTIGGGSHHWRDAPQVPHFVWTPAPAPTPS